MYNFRENLQTTHYVISRLNSSKIETYTNSRANVTGYTSSCVARASSMYRMKPQTNKLPSFNIFRSKLNPCRMLSCYSLTVFTSAQSVNTRYSVHGRLNTNQRFSKRRFIFFASVNDVISDSEIESDDNTDQEEDDILIEDDEESRRSESSGGRPGFISFYNQPYKKEPQIVVSTITKSNGINLFWFVGPAVLVASFIFPSLYMRKILSTVFEDSLLTDFLILFFTEALFYCGVAVFLKIVDHLRRPKEPINTKNDTLQSPQLVYRITSVAALVLSLVIPMVTMGLVWPWTGPAASATLAPYLVGIVVQFAFEQYARYIKSPSWPLIPVIFQVNTRIYCSLDSSCMFSFRGGMMGWSGGLGDGLMGHNGYSFLVYRLHQLNRAAQLVTALSFTVRGAESTPHNLAINSSLGMLLNVLQGLGVICIWSLSSFLMRFLPSATIPEQ
ncbi:hypothetical protein CTI12_AA583530 [Artemisia annua]|uniref:Transmembrane protein n=1 Tax=Artemisia annua TaxID=35608 RepID=A0A2U1KMK4_ARTAN|nr:hypothetical protein CTI12_AA583530 [Artemisia annua]